MIKLGDLVVTNRGETVKHGGVTMLRGRLHSGNLKLVQ